MKKVLSIICVLALVVTLASSFTYAATPEPTEVSSAGEGARASTQYRVSRTGTYMYNSASESSGYKYNFPIPVNTVLQYLSQSGNFYYLRYTSGGSTYTGYVLKSHVAPVY